MNSKVKRRLAICGCAVAGTVVGYGWYLQSHSLVFNESFWSHAHCIKGGGMSLQTYAHEHAGRFPFHTNGYGDALLLVNAGWDAALTGPGYDTRVFDRARKTGEDANEIEFGRVYVQGLSVTDPPEIAILFDKIPTPGGDHCHMLRRLFAPLGREVWTIGSGMRFVPETEWSSYSKAQIDMLVKAGISKEQAERYYSEEVKSQTRGIR